MKVLVNKCPYTGKLFEDNKKYANHLAVLRRERARARAAQKLRIEFFDWLAEEKEKIISLDMIVPWFLENQRKLMDAVNAGVRPKKGYSSGWDNKFYDTDKFTKLSLKGKYSDLVSNSHNCPDNGVTNWGGSVEGAPSGYPGWHCRVEGRLERLPKHMGSYPYSSVLNLIGLKTGTGGGGNDNFGYGVEIYLADWPGLSREVLFHKLNGKKVA